MKVTLACVGRLRGGPETTLVADYLARAEATGRAHGLAPVRLREVEARAARAQPEEEARLLLAACPGALIILLDETGEAWPSAEIARRLASWRDQGAREAAFLIGGADGHGPAARAAATARLAFGPQTWPHRLARVMAAEQIYRAAAILAGTPYHRA